MDPEIKRLCDAVRETGFAAHKYLKHGHAEKVYENSLANRLRKQGFKVEIQLLSSSHFSLKIS